MDTPNSKRLPEFIYVRRRVAAVVILVLVVALLVWLMSVFSGVRHPKLQPAGDSTNAAATSSTTETGTTGTTASSSSTSVLPAPGDISEVGTSTSAVSAGMKRSCELSDLLITARSDRDSYPVGEQPHLYMTVKNPTPMNCEIDLKRNTLRFEIYDLATNKRIWSDVDCNPEEDSELRNFPAGEERYYESVWSRTHSAPNSCNNRDLVPGGSYYMYTLIGDNHSDPITFNLLG